MAMENCRSNRCVLMYPMRIFTRIGICHLSPPSQNPRFPRATAAPPPPLSPLILPPASQKLHQWEAHIMLSPPV